MTSHPLHPVLVHFPLACWVLATMIDVAGQFVAIPHFPALQWASFSHVLLWAGVALALPAMLAGIADYTGLQPEVQESDELTWHIAAMTTAWLLFLGAALWRAAAAPFASAPSWGMVLVEIAGSICLIVGGRFAAIVVYDRIPASKYSAMAQKSNATGEQS